MWCQLESASADRTRVSGEEIAPFDAKGWASVLPFQSLARVGAGGGRGCMASPAAPI